MKLFCDNKYAINIAHTLMEHDKHVVIDCDFIKQKLEAWLICITFVPSENQLASNVDKSIGFNEVSRIVMQAENERYLLTRLRGSVRNP